MLRSASRHSFTRRRRFSARSLSIRQMLLQKKKKKKDVLGVSEEPPVAKAATKFDAKVFLATLLPTQDPSGSLPLDRIDETLANKVLSLDNVGVEKAKKPEGRRAFVMTAQERRALDKFSLKPEESRYELFLPMHELWVQYMTELLQLESQPLLAATLQNKITKADLHGCILTVTRSKCWSFVGASGIVVQETENAFHLVTTANKTKMIPKENSIFSFSLPGLTATIFGNHFRFRASERAVKKFKAKASIEL
eukprot:m.348118 g.348118  ORF g.348118 m.348118 type:complete len:252 (-) comp55864_c1_seq11:64-819(-)